MSYIELSIRLVLSFLTLFILTRIMGRKEISQMTFFNFVSAISIGTIGASLAIDPSLKISYGLTALVLWTIFTVVFGIIDIKSQAARKIIVGQPVILIQKGELLEDALRKVRLDVDSLNALLRKKNVFSVSDVDYAIFETDGSVSVMKKETKQPLTKSDLNIQQVSHNNMFPIPTAVVSDGEINNENLNKLNLNKQWLDQQLQSKGINSVSKVFYAEVQKDGTLYVDKIDGMTH
ncbi:DUF421 domain-containing protein [Chungangia koreensis]|uniref:DUF421 domain-containing protein n=1 Tax=Chungangia koreensis TaxID=752657 RepID=A0ABV8X7P7_9LACT